MPAFKPIETGILVCDTVLLLTHLDGIPLR